MISRRLVGFAAVACIAVMVGVLPAQESIFEALAAPGEKVTLTTGEGADGSRGSMRTSTNPDGSFKSFEASGRVVLRSPKINLDADRLTYDAAVGNLLATGDVKMTQPGVEASCRDLTYSMASGEVVLTGEPIVSQSAEGSSTVFSGMETFKLVQKEGGRSEIQLTDGQEILCKSTSAAAEAGAEEKAASGLGAFGENVQILVRPRGTRAPSVFIDAGEDGGFGMFRALGSVMMESDSMNLRADQLEFDGVKNSIEALYNVYVKQENIEADCGRMVYDLTKDRIVLSVNPFVRERRPDGVVNISEMDSFIIVRNTDGSTSTEALAGPQGSPKFEYQAREAARPVATPASTEAREISPDKPETINQID